MVLPLNDSIARQKQLRTLRNDDIIAARADLLAPEDRDLIKAVVINGQSAEMIARIAGVRGSTLRKRVRKLLKRINSPDFIDTARILPLLNPTQLAVAKAHILQGKSIRAVASETNLSYHTVRKTLTQVRAIAAGVKNLKKNYPSLIGSN